MVTLVKKSIVVIMVKDSWSLDTLATGSFATRVDIKANIIKSKKKYICIVHYTWYAYDC